MVELSAVIFIVFATMTAALKGSTILTGITIMTLMGAFVSLCILAGVVATRVL